MSVVGSLLRLGEARVSDTVAEFAVEDFVGDGVAIHGNDGFEFGFAEVEVVVLHDVVEFVFDELVFVAVIGFHELVQKIYVFYSCYFGW